jgi:hypothetical protein
MSSWPFYVINSGSRKGEIRQFLFVTESEFAQLGEQRAKKLELSRTRSRRVSADPELKRKWSQRRSEQRRSNPGVRERENELRRKRRRMTLAGK